MLRLVGVEDSDRVTVGNLDDGAFNDADRGRWDEMETRMSDSTMCRESGNDGFPSSPPRRRQGNYGGSKNNGNIIWQHKVISVCSIHISDSHLLYSTPLRNAATGGLYEKNRLRGCCIPLDWQRLWWWWSCCRRLSTAVPPYRSSPAFTHDDNQCVHLTATHNQIQAQHRFV